MASPTGGRWIFSVDTTSGFSGVILGINNGVAPVFPAAVSGKFNIEVFTNPTVAGLVAPPNPDAGFQTSMIDPNGTIGNDGLLTGTTLRLASGDFLAVDSVTGSATQSGSKITLGTGKQTVVGAKFDTLIGGQAPGVGQILSALLGNETVIGGTSDDSIWGGANDYIVAGSGNNQIVVTGTGTTVVAGMAGNAVVSLTANDTLTSLPGSTQNAIIAAGANNRIDLTGNVASKASAVIGQSGDTITAGGGVTNIEGAAGGMQIKVGAAGTTNLSGGTSSVAGNTVAGGAGGFNFNPSAIAGKGDLINLSGGTGTATINAFAFQSTRIVASDTILATNNADSIFGGAGDRIGTGNGSVVGGTHQWVHADTVAGSTVGFGSNDTVASTTYNTVSGTATRGTVAGTSSAQVTVGSFNTATDFLFYQNETAATNAAIVATSQATTIAGQNSTIVTLPDGTVMTLVGVTQAQLQAALTAGTLFKA